MAKARKALPSSRYLIYTPALIKKTWGNLHKLWRKKLFCAKAITTLGDLTVEKKVTNKVEAEFSKVTDENGQFV